MKNLSRRSLLLGLSASAFADSLISFAAPLMASGSLVFVGGYTDKGSSGKGIYAYRWDAAKGELQRIGLAAETANPSFLAIHPANAALYAVNEVDNYKATPTAGKPDGSVSAFALDAKTGKLTLLNVVSSGGAGPCNITLDATGKAVLVANYVGGSAATFKVLPGGKLSEHVDDLHYGGHGPNKERQATSHAHCATATPDNGHVLINDLGLDKIHIYKFDPAAAKLTRNDPAGYESLPNSGPRSLVFHPNGRFAYTTNELSNTLDVLAWDATAGSLTRLQNIATAEHPGDAKNTAASVAVDKAGRFVYASNRGPENSIAVFSVDASTGKLTFLQRIESGGKTPRHFAIDPSQKWIVVAHQGSNNLVVFKRDPTSGKLSATGRTYPIDAPTCVLFA